MMSHTLSLLVPSSQSTDTTSINPASFTSAPNSTQRQLINHFFIQTTGTLVWKFCLLLIILGLHCNASASIDKKTNIEFIDSGQVLSTALAFNQQQIKTGVYWNPLRSGWGINIVKVTQSNNTVSLVTVIYTYRVDGTSVWYLASAPMTGTEWSATLQEYQWDGTAAIPIDIGNIKLQFNAADQAEMSYTINEQSGSEPIEFLEYAQPPTQTDLSALWFPPTELGSGLTFSTIGNTSFAAIYHFSADGSARWHSGAAAQAVEVGQEIIVPVNAFTGYCLACQTIAPSIVSTGKLRLKFNSFTNAQFETIDIPDWQSNINIIALSDLPDNGDTIPTANETPLAIISSSPTNQAFFIDINTRISIQFNTDIDEDSLIAAFSINNNTKGSLDYNSETNTAIFTPSSPLETSSLYTITIKDTLTSKNGLRASENLNLSFKTAGPPLTSNDLKMETVLLDLAPSNRESDTDTIALAQALDITGIPYRQTESLDDAIQYKIMYVSSYISNSTFNPTETQQLIDYVARGGIVISRSVSDSDLYDLFGISAQSRSNTRQTLRWDVASGDPALKYFDAEQEITISLGGGDHSAFINTRSYSPNQGMTLAQYNDDSAAVIKNISGEGATYLLGISYADMTLRNQMNLDFQANRGAFNDYEPTTDAFMLFLRAIYEDNMPFASWKHTSSSDSQATLIITHDIDSQSSVDKIQAFAELEAEKGISATYNITTHYIDDAIDDDFFTENTAQYRHLLRLGHSIASHSVGHFPDWHKEKIFPLGTVGNTKENYQPHYDGTISSNATVFGELEVSKNLLDTQIGTDIKTFRSGHLLWNENQATAMEALGYSFDSSLSANDALTNFPFRVLYERSINAPMSGIYEFPVNISGSASGGDTTQTAVDIWLNMLNNNATNSALTVLLIHPNRDFKLEELNAFIQQLPDNIQTHNMDDFGHYWTARDQFHYTRTLDDNKLTLTLAEDTTTPINPNISLVIKNGVDLVDFSIKTFDGSTLSYQSSIFNNSDLIVYGLQ